MNIIKGSILLLILNIGSIGGPRYLLNNGHFSIDEESMCMLRRNWFFDIIHNDLYFILLKAQIILL